MSCSMSQRRERADWATYHALGVQFQGQLPRLRTLAEVGRALGVSKQKAWHASVLALGKLIYRLKAEVKS